MLIIGAVMLIMAGCNNSSRWEHYRAEKHVRDSVGLADQLRSIDYYQTQLDALLPQADSLIALFSYEKNDKYQDHGFYVVKNEKLKIKYYDLRVMVRDDGKELLVYRNGKRLSNERVNELKNEGNQALDRAEHLHIIIHDIKELEKRISQTSLEIQKYQKRLTNERVTNE